MGEHNGNNDYLTAPCDLWRGLIKDKMSVLNDVLYWQIVIRDYDIERAKRDCSVIYGDEANAKTRARDLGDKQHKKVLFSISRTMFWDFHDNEKTQEELLLLLFILASKSIVGHKTFTLTNTKHLWCRMAGYESVKDWTNANTSTKNLTDKVIRDHLADKRKMQRKTQILREKAAASFHYCSYSERGVRGFYISTKAVSDDEKNRLMREMRDAARKPTKRQQERERLKKIQNEEMLAILENS